MVARQEILSTEQLERLDEELAAHKRDGVGTITLGVSLVELLRADRDAQKRRNRRLSEKAKLLADAAEAVDKNIMESGLAFRREAMRYAIGDVRDALAVHGSGKEPDA